MRILVLDGSEPTPARAVLPRELSTRRILVERASTLAEGLALAGRKRYAAIVIERGESPQDVVRRLRADFGTPILVLREVKDSDDAIACLECGADDVLIEPLDVDELVARLRSLSRRCLPGNRAMLRVDDMELDARSMQVTRGGAPVSLTDHEFELLEYMMSHHDRVLGHDELLDQLSAAASEISARDLDAMIDTLRQKLQTGTKRPLLHRVDERGYMLSEMPPLVG